MENAPLSPRAPHSPVGRLTAYGKLAFGHLPTGLGKPAAGFPQPPSFDDDLSLLPMHISNCRHRTKLVDAGQFGLERLAQGEVWTVRFPPDGQTGGRLFGCFDFLMPGVLTDGGTPWAFVLDFENTGGNMAVISMDGQTVFNGTGRYKLLDEDGDTVMYVLDLEPVSESDLSVMEFSERCGKRVPDGPRSATHEALVLRKLSEGKSGVLQSVVYAVEQGAPPGAEETLLSIWESIARNGRGE